MFNLVNVQQIISSIASTQFIVARIQVPIPLPPLKHFHWLSLTKCHFQISSSAFITITWVTTHIFFHGNENIWHCTKLDIIEINGIMKCFNFSLWPRTLVNGNCSNTCNHTPSKTLWYPGYYTMALDDTKQPMDYDRFFSHLWYWIKWWQLSLKLICTFDVSPPFFYLQYWRLGRG